MHTKLQCVTELKNALIEELKANKDCWGPAKFGEVVDMVKDLAEAEEKCWKACYYKEIVCAMDEAREEEGGERMGYDNRRYASGRYAPKGKGHYSPVFGYNPMHGPYMMEEPGHDGMRMGYPITKNQTGSEFRYGATDTDRSDYGRSYDGYRKARRGYHDTHSETDKRRMDDHAKAHLSETVATMREMWDGADQPLKQKMKADLTKLVGEMNV